MKRHRKPLAGIVLWALVVSSGFSEALAQAENTVEEAALGKIFAAGGDQRFSDGKTIPFKGLIYFSPDGKYQARTTKQGKIKVRRTSDAALKTFYACSPTALAISSDSKLLAAAGPGKACGKSEQITIKVWGLDKGEWIAEFHTPGKQAEGLAVSEKRIVISTESGLHSYQLPNGKKEWSMAKPGEIREMKLSSDGGWFMASFADGKIRTYSAGTGIERQFRR